MQITLTHITRILVVVAVILLIPLILTIRDGGVEGQGWNWTPSDFLFMGVLLFVTGLAIEIALQMFKTLTMKIGAVLIIILALLLVWAELAVDAISRFLGFL